jgi:hypothetical protein
MHGLRGAWCIVYFCSALLTWVAEPGRHSVQLAPAISAVGQNSAARGVFYRQSHQLQLESAVLLISSSPDGAGDLCTDDQATLIFRPQRGAPQVWSWLFADARRQQITCAPAQRLTLAAGPGEYVVEIILTDRFPSTYSSRPYFLVAPARLTTAPAPPAPTPPTTGAVPTTSAVASPTPPPSATPTLARATPAPAVAPVALVAPPPELARPVAVWPPAAALIGAALLALLLALLLLRRATARPAPVLSGIVDLRDQATGEACTALLYRFTTGAAIVRGPLGLAPPDDPATRARQIALISPGPTGPLLQTTDVPLPEPVQLREGAHLLIAHSVELRYRSAAPHPQPLPATRRRP